jgi:hypothetical protein
MNPVDRERISDCSLLIRSVKTLLQNVDSKIVPELPQIEQCLDSAHTALNSALGRV